jgi:hypothetical protein
MPYIKQERRPDLDRIVDHLAHILRFDGDLNYVLFALCHRGVPLSYKNIRNFLGELTEAGEEIRRRILAKYEDKKIEINGDVW